MTSACNAPDIAAFERGSVDPAAFPHAAHVRLGFEMLGRYDFGEAVSRFSRGLRLLANKAGKPQLYHETITVAFLAIIAERRARGSSEDWETFCAANDDVFDKHCLQSWYAQEQLDSDIARKTFCLPAPRF
jgi:hypothetical protein